MASICAIVKGMDMCDKLMTSSSQKYRLSGAGSQQLRRVEGQPEGNCCRFPVSRSDFGRLNIVIIKGILLRLGAAQC